MPQCKTGTPFVFSFGKRLKSGFPVQSNSRKGVPKIMKRYLIVLVLAAGLTQWGCAFLGGAAVGSLATGAGYEYNSKRQMDRLEDDYRHERISRSEYEKRKSQIERGSIIY